MVMQFKDWFSSLGSRYSSNIVLARAVATLDPWNDDISILSKCPKLTFGVRTPIRILVWSLGVQNVQQCSTVPRPPSHQV